MLVLSSSSSSSASSSSSSIWFVNSFSGGLCLSGSCECWCGRAMLCGGLLFISLGHLRRISWGDSCSVNLQGFGLQNRGALWIEFPNLRVSGLIFGFEEAQQRVTVTRNSKYIKQVYCLVIKTAGPASPKLTARTS